MIRIKYPRTFHLPWSRGVTSDDKVLSTVDAWEGMPIIVTEKMDGENTTLYRHGFHARSIDSVSHPSRSILASMHAEIGHDIPEGMRVCGENVYAKHSIYYTDLPSYFLGFSVWEGNTCLSWDDTLVWFDLLGIEPVRTLMVGEFNQKVLKELAEILDASRIEGYVVRRAGAFTYDNFSNSVAKFVRAHHVQTDDHWMYKSIVPNKLAFCEEVPDEEA